MSKVGRNSPCHCGSGKKYKKCCLRKDRIAGAKGLRQLFGQKPPQVRATKGEFVIEEITDPSELRDLEAVREQVHADLARRKEERAARYGYVRPIISQVGQGKRFVVVGSGLHYANADAWKTVPDFLFHYIRVTLGEGWGTNEIKTKPLAERHPILQWYNSVCLLQERYAGTKTKGGLYSGERDGPTAAYLLLAYDLYVVADHQKLQERLVERLKHPDQFQGARYELAVATHCIRAGFDLEHEDESDPSRQHPEFIATHKETGQVIAVEAKSRHRPGVLGRLGEKQEEPRAGVRSIVNKALKKTPDLPYAVFVDLNLPPSEGSDIREIAWFQELLGEVGKWPEDEPSPFNLLTFTNHPQHYGEEAEPDPGSSRVSVVALKPKMAVDHPEALKALHDAAQQYGNLPNWFDE